MASEAGALPTKLWVQVGEDKVLKHGIYTMKVKLPEASPLPNFVTTSQVQAAAQTSGQAAREAELGHSRYYVGLSWKRDTTL